MYTDTLFLFGNIDLTKTKVFTYKDKNENYIVICYNELVYKIQDLKSETKKSLIQSTDKKLLDLILEEKE